MPSSFTQHILPHIGWLGDRATFLSTLRLTMPTVFFLPLTARPVPAPASRLPRTLLPHAPLPSSTGSSPDGSMLSGGVRPSSPFTLLLLSGPSLTLCPSLTSPHLFPVFPFFRITNARSLSLSCPLFPNSPAPPLILLGPVPRLATDVEAAPVVILSLLPGTTRTLFCPVTKSIRSRLFRTSLFTIRFSCRKRANGSEVSSR